MDLATIITTTAATNSGRPAEDLRGGVVIKESIASRGSKWGKPRGDSRTSRRVVGRLVAGSQREWQLEVGLKAAPAAATINRLILLLTGCWFNWRKSERKREVDSIDWQVEDSITACRADTIGKRLGETTQQVYACCLTARASKPS